MSFNTNSPTIKRLMSEMRALRASPEKDFVAGPVDENLFLWHFTIKGPRDTPFEGGIYHGKIVFPQQYPYSPPDIYFLTPNGRFETGKKICLTITSFHPDQWNPAWDVRTALTSIIAFMPTPSEGAVGGMEMSDSQRRKLALESRSWHCKDCQLHIEPDEIKEKSNDEETNADNDENQNDENTENTENNNPENNNNNNNDITNDNDDEQEKIIANDNNLVEEEEEKNDINDLMKDIDDNANKADNVAEKNVEEVEKHQDGPYVDEDGISHYNFDELRSVQFENKQSFICILDIPIIILFFLLLFLIANSAFNFVHFFDFD